MKTNILGTTIGSTINVNVGFDYKPDELARDDCPASMYEVDIYAVWVDSLIGGDLVEVLSQECLDALKIECHEDVVAKRLAAMEDV